MTYLFIPLVAGFASLLTFFSGFGLGTLLTPTLYLFFEPIEALALSGIVHFLNNVFKFGLVRRNVHYDTLLKFGITAIVGAFVGAYLLKQLASPIIIYEYDLGEKHFSVSLIKFSVAILMLVFTIIELLPAFKNYTFDSKYLPIGGLLSGFFGGLSGNQGALRTMFLTKLGLSKEAFIATGIAIACLIDISRLSMYYQQIQNTTLTVHLPLLFLTTIAAFSGAYFGNKWLKKATLHFVQKIVTIALILISVALLLGWV